MSDSFTIYRNQRSANWTEARILQGLRWDYVYQKDATITRPMCMVMNELARLISGCEDDWWK